MLLPNTFPHAARRLALLLGISLLAPVVHAAKAERWVAAGHLGSFKLVALEKRYHKNTQVFWEALRANCEPKSHCNVLFVDAKAVAEIRVLPEREQLERALLVYTTNRGFEWNCRLRPEADNCFSWPAGKDAS